MLHDIHLVCPNINCNYAIDSDSLNKIQLKVLMMTAKKCPKCGKLAKFLEQTSLLNIQNKTSKYYGGILNENTIKETRRDAIDARRRALRSADRSA